jgi:UDP-N-acetyl-D-mannosaminuronate dehydrogenase
VAVGGHCIPVYPRLYLAGDPGARLPATARDINEQMPGYAVELLAGELGSLRGVRVLILGVSFRGGVRETAFSGAFALRDELLQQGAHPFATDPLYTEDELNAVGFSAWDREPIDGAILQADHREYADLTPDDLPGIRGLVDGRGIVEEGPWVAAEIPIARIGQPRRHAVKRVERVRREPGSAGTRPRTAGLR